MVVNVSQKDKTIERVRERLSQAYCEIAPRTPDSAIQYLDAYDALIRNTLHKTTDTVTRTCHWKNQTTRNKEKNYDHARLLQV